MPPPRSFNNLRVGETAYAIAQPKDQEGNTAFVENGDFQKVGSDEIIAVVEVDLDPPLRVAEIEALEPGEQSFTYTAVNSFFDEVTYTQRVRVLDADRLVFGGYGNPPSNCTIVMHDLGEPFRITVTPTSGDPATFTLNATPQDERGTQSPSPYSVSHINWSTVNGKVFFDTGGGPGPAASGTLSLTIQCVEAGDDVITLTAQSSRGVLLTATFALRVAATTTVVTSYSETLP